MQQRDWVILAILLVLAGWFGGDRLRETPAGRYLAGECEWPRSITSSGWSGRDSCNRTRP